MHLPPSARSSTSLIALLLGIFASAARGDAEGGPAVDFEQKPGQLAITVGGKPFASYVYADEKITRPYFAHLRTAGGVQVTRNHPPVKGQDLPDHDTYHPGLWMAFGDIDGSDYWRLAAPVKFDRFVKEPHGGPGRGTFTARYDYIDQKDPDHVVCHEDFACDVRVVPAGVLILWDSTFSSDEPFTFGDQEEMGLGFRIATPLRAERESDLDLPPGNGEIANAVGGRNEEETWGEPADWCDYSGVADGERVGIAIFAHPKNFRPSWYHSRDYGLVVANAFGQAAFGKGDKSAVTIEPGDTMRLRYGVLVHGGPNDHPQDMAAKYRDYVNEADE